MTGRRPGESRGASILRVDWMPGIGLLTAAVGAGAVLGYTAGTGRPPVYLAATVCALVGALAWNAWRQGRRPAASAPARGRAPLPGPARVPFDLSRDRSTDAQKYVM